MIPSFHHDEIPLLKFWKFPYRIFAMLSLKVLKKVAVKPEGPGETLFRS